jgi:hypothetical protein
MKKVNPFGDAKPREVNLQSRFHKIDNPNVIVPYPPPCKNDGSSTIPERDRIGVNTDTDRASTETMTSLSKAPKLQETTTTTTTSPPKKVATKVNPFGNAKPREQNLAKRGIDVKILDESIEIKASVPNFTPQQEAVLEEIRVQLTHLCDAWEERQQQQQQEEEKQQQQFDHDKHCRQQRRGQCLQRAMEDKRRELHDKMEEFARINRKKQLHGVDDNTSQHDTEDTASCSSHQVSLSADTRTPHPNNPIDKHDDHPSGQSRDRNDRHSSTDIVGFRECRNEVYGHHYENRTGKNPSQNNYYKNRHGTTSNDDSPQYYHERSDRSPRYQNTYSRSELPHSYRNRSRYFNHGQEKYREERDDSGHFDNDGAFTSFSTMNRRRQNKNCSYYESSRRVPQQHVT